MFEPGTQVGRYEIQRRLGRGGMGTVYVAHDPVLGRMVAIKVFAGDLDVPDARERFSREARAAAALNHPNIVTVYDFGEFESQPYIVMEYVPGETLASVIRRKAPLAMTDKLRWMEELCAGAGYAHQMSVVHRDIKPANLMIDRSSRLKILDFGIARMLGIASNTSVMIGTPGYMAPEQITGDPVDHRSDQFSIGVVFYELLAYAEPFAGDTLPMITHRIVSQEPTPLGQLVPDVSPELVDIVGQALKKSSAHRFANTDAMRAAIGRVRRHYETDGDWNTPTMPVGRSTPPPSGSRGTGSARRRSSDSVGVAQMTPPPDPKRTDREALARRRITQIEAALDLARTFFAQRHLDEALDACQQALTLDEGHIAALELEAEIETAIRIREGVEIAADDAGVTSATPSLNADLTASALLQSQAVTRLDVEVYRVTGLPPESSDQLRETAAPALAGVGHTNVSAQTVLRPAVVPPVDATIIAPSRRTPAPAPAVAKAPQGPAKAVKAAKPAQVPLAQRVASALQRFAPAVSGVGKAVRDSVPGTSKALGIWVAAGIGVVALVGAGVYVLTRGPAPTGTAVIDAVPWATISSIRNEDGDQIPLPSPASTPVSLALPAGTYQITLAGPEPESRTATVNVRVDVGGTSVVPITRFQSMTVEEYFEQYLGAGEAVAPADPDPVPTETGPAPAAAPPAGAGQ